MRNNNAIDKYKAINYKCEILTYTRNLLFHKVSTKKEKRKTSQATQGHTSWGSVETENVAQNTNRNLL